ncbi:lysozyme family protein [Enterococcus sp. HY326]|uniref:lysozyme family protein n=1 Tax=Enterococcus sp. HY326 TaxID=2971265 RepID=UPI00223EEEA1|nr:lysozyme family protein [Enterococcus sp. HY326]
MRKKRRGPLGCLFMLIKLIILVSLLVALFIGYRTYTIIKRVESFRPEVETLASQYGISDHETLILAIIYTESKGSGTDLMQSSESLSGEPDSINTQADSIEQGISYLSGAIETTEAAGDNLSTAIQSYNFGHDYIAYVSENGGTSTVSLAETYSREVLTPLLGNQTAETYRYYKWQAILYNGGYLYSNGGNFFYSQIVQDNQKLIEFYESIFG